ncbi:MAG: Asp-tRNA(Asn)/Glu-tRNA(Gln) amidotransferase GatCAB subunit B, partial [Terriglobia bacterium]
AEKMEQITDPAAIEKLCRQVLEKNADKVEQYRKGKQALFGFFVGQAMKASRGQANPARVNDTLKRLLAGN